MKKIPALFLAVLMVMSLINAAAAEAAPAEQVAAFEEQNPELVNIIDDAFVYTARANWNPAYIRDNNFGTYYASQGDLPMATYIGFRNNVAVSDIFMDLNNINDTKNMLIQIIYEDTTTPTLIDMGSSPASAFVHLTAEQIGTDRKIRGIKLLKLAGAATNIIKINEMDVYTTAEEAETSSYSKVMDRFIDENPDKTEITQNAALSNKGGMFSDISRIRDGNPASSALQQDTLYTNICLNYSAPILASDIFIYQDLAVFSARWLDDYRFIQVWLTYSDSTTEKLHDYGYAPADQIVHLTPSKAIKKIEIRKPTLADSTGRPDTYTTNGAMQLNEIKVYATNEAIEAAKTPEQRVAEFVAANPDKTNITKMSNVTYRGTNWDSIGNLTDGNYSSVFTQQDSLPHNAKLTFTFPMKLTDVFMVTPYISSDDSDFIQIWATYSDGTTAKIHDSGYHTTGRYFHITPENSSLDANKRVVSLEVRKPTLAASTDVPSGYSGAAIMRVSELAVYTDPENIINNVNVAKGKPVTPNASQTYYSESTNYARINDGSTASFCYVNANQPTAPYFIIDLGNCYDINTVSLTMRADGYNAADCSDTYILGSMSMVPIDQMEEITKTPASSSPIGAGKSYIYELPQAKKYRYIAVSRKLTDWRWLAFAEVSVYSEISTDFSGWTVKDSGGNAVFAIAEGKYTACVNATAYSKKPGSCIMLLAGYDAAGKVTEISCKKVEITGSGAEELLSADITLPAGTVKMSCMLIDDLQSAKTVIDSKTLLSN